MRLLQDFTTLSKKKNSLRFFSWTLFIQYSLLCIFFSFVTLPGLAQSKKLKEQRAAYRDKYKDMAIAQMKEHGVPASITLAQGMLESRNGLSRLATEGNNHFGIKCHKAWKGKKMYQDDDAKGECFRVYKSAEHSFSDHSLFLRGARRYAFLFDLPATDYKGWAKGLKKAGYATDPKYAEHLIRIIEEENLTIYDTGVKIEVESPTVGTQRELAQNPEYEIKMGEEHPIYERNRVQYIIVQQHDTYLSLTRAMEMMPWELARYNELPSRELPPPGTELYIQPKRRKAEVNHAVHVVEEGETIYSIAQKYAIKSKYIYKRNRMKRGEEPEVGQLLYLRKKAPKN